MTTFQSHKTLPYSPKELFELVEDVDAYPLFLPWIASSKVFNRKPNQFLADLVIQFNQIRKEYTSLVLLKPHSTLQIRAIKGPFRYMNCIWRFEPKGANETEVHFWIHFEVNFLLMDKLFKRYFEDSARKVMGAFEKRAAEIYQ